MTIGDTKTDVNLNLSCWEQLLWAQMNQIFSDSESDSKTSLQKINNYIKNNKNENRIQFMGNQQKNIIGIF